MPGLRFLPLLPLFVAVTACSGKDEGGTQRDGGADSVGDGDGIEGGSGGSGSGGSGSSGSGSEDCPAMVDRLEVIQQTSPSTIRVGYRPVDCEGRPLECINPDGLVASSGGMPLVSNGPQMLDRPKRNVAVLFDVSTGADAVREEVMATTHAVIDQVFSDDPSGLDTHIFALPLGDPGFFDWIEHEPSAEEFKAAVDSAVANTSFSERDLYGSLIAAHGSLLPENILLPGDPHIIVITAGAQQSSSTDATLNQLLSLAEDSAAEVCVFALSNGYNSDEVAPVATAPAGTVPCFHDEPSVTDSPSAIAEVLSRRWRQGVWYSDVCLNEEPAGEIDITVLSGDETIKGAVDVSGLELVPGDCSSFQEEPGDYSVCELPEEPVVNGPPHPNVPDTIPACLELVALRYGDENGWVCEDGEPDIFGDAAPTPGAISSCGCAQPREGAEDEWMYDFGLICETSADQPSLTLHVDPDNWDYSRFRVQFGDGDFDWLVEYSGWQYGEGWRRYSGDLAVPVRGVEVAFLERASCR